MLFIVRIETLSNDTVCQSEVRIQPNAVTNMFLVKKPVVGQLCVKRL